ncbi:hypothetical protein D3C85_1241120 [compost metagenome]
MDVGCVSAQGDATEAHGGNHAVRYVKVRAPQHGARTPALRQVVQQRRSEADQAEPRARIGQADKDGVVAEVDPGLIGWRAVQIDVDQLPGLGPGVAGEVEVQRLAHGGMGAVGGE